MSHSQWLGAAIPGLAPCLPWEPLPDAARFPRALETQYPRESHPRAPEHQPSSCPVPTCPSSSLNFLPFFWKSLSFWKSTQESYDAGGYDERWNRRKSPKLQIEKLQNLSARGRDYIYRKVPWPTLSRHRSALKFGSLAHFFIDLPFQFFCSANFVRRNFPRQLSVWIQHQCNTFPPERFLNQF